MSRSEGFTLVEVVIGSFLTVLVLLGAVAMTLTALGQLGRGEEQTTAATLGQQRIEWMRNQGYSSADLTAGTTLENLSGTYEGYSRTTVVQNDTPRAGVKQITVTIATPSGRSLEFASFVGE